jgi:signal peptidase II
MKKYIFPISVLVFLDQISKILARNFFDPPIRVLSDFFQLKTVFNEGIAFSLPFPQVFLILLTIVVLIFLLFYLIRKTPSQNEQVVVILIFSGAMGNLIDRLIFQSVTDFFSFWSFPIFNFADIFITSGVVLFFFIEFCTAKLLK